MILALHGQSFLSKTTSQQDTVQSCPDRPLACGALSWLLPSLIPENHWSLELVHFLTLWSAPWACLGLSLAYISFAQPETTFMQLPQLAAQPVSMYEGYFSVARLPGQGSLQSCSILPVPRFVCQPHNWDSGTTCYYHLAQQNECESFTCCPLLVRLLQKRTQEMQNTPSSLYTIHGYSCGHLLWKLGLLTPRLTSFLSLAQLAVACSMENQ